MNAPSNKLKVSERDRIVQEITAGKAPRLREFINQHGGVAEVAKRTRFSAANLQRMLDCGSLPRRTKLRQIVEALVPEPRRELTEQEHAQVLMKFSRLEGRGGVKLGFLPMGPTVAAKNPEELKQASDEQWVGEALKQKPS